jgi:hypothetical protein
MILPLRFAFLLGALLPPGLAHAYLPPAHFLYSRIAEQKVARKQEVFLLLLEFG